MRIKITKIKRQIIENEYKKYQKLLISGTRENLYNDLWCFISHWLYRIEMRRSLVWDERRSGSRTGKFTSACNILDILFVVLTSSESISDLPVCLFSSNKLIYKVIFYSHLLTLNLLLHRSHRFCFCTYTQLTT